MTTNRHGEENKVFYRCAQLTLNKHADKPSLGTMGLLRLLLKLCEEVGELVWEMLYQPLRKLLRLPVRWWRVEQEAIDVYVVLLAIFIWSRREGK